MKAIETLLFILTFASTWFLIGVSWFLQVVHYPLFKAAAKDDFALYGQAHANLSVGLLLPAMGVELISATLLILFHPAPMTLGETLFGVALVVAIWQITTFLLVPAQKKLVLGYEEEVHQRLLLASWLRTLAWTLRGILLLFASYRLIIV